MFVRVLLLLLFLPACTTAAFALPHWLWKGDRQPGSRLVLQRTFNVAPGWKSAHLRVVADFAIARLSINGKPAGTAEPYGPVLELDAAGFLRPGSNEIRLSSRSVAGCPAVALQLDIVDARGREQTISTTPQWQSARPGEKVESYGDLGLEKWWGLGPLVIDESDDYTQWKRASNAKAGTNPATFELLPGYRVELLRSAGKDEGSWVSLAFDPQGRLTIGREDKGLIRYSFSADRREITLSEMVNNDLRECRGLLYAHGSLYVNANNSKGLYRLRDTNGDGRFDEKKLLHSSKGSVGHGRNALALGPEGSIYAIHGDAVELPRDIPDRTSPLRRGAAPFRPNEGHVLRMAPDGSSREIFCAGMRNPYGIAFNPDGEPFTYDADAEFDMGTPWYRPTRVLHLSSGADFGWRAVTGSWPPYYPDHPDNTGPALDIGKGSPTGVRFGTRSRFPPQYRKALYILDWAYGRILAVHLFPRGATYMGATEVFLRGQPLNLTDLDFGPDGAMYFTVGGRNTQGALYRVSYSGPAVSERAKTRQEKAREEMARKMRKRRREVEAHHGKGKFYDGVLSKPSDDCRTAQSVRIALEHSRENPATAVRLRKVNSAGARVELLTAEANIAAAQEIPALVEKWLEESRDWGNWPPSAQLGFIDLFRRCMARHKLPEATRKRISSALRSHFPAGLGQVNRALAPVLVELEPVHAVEKIVKLLEESTGQVERLHYLHHLRNTGAGWTQPSRRTFFEVFATRGSFLGGRGMPQVLKNIERDSLATLGAEERRGLKGLIGQAAALPPLPDLAGRRLVKEWKPGDFRDALAFDPAGRDLANGRKVFSMALCSRCHRYGGEGYLVGPELTYVARRFSRRDLISEILEPSRTIAENYRTSVLELKDGRVLSGQVIPNLDYRDPNLQFAADPLHPDKISKISKASIIRRRRSAVSLMPAGLLNNFSREEILDLLAWLESGGKAGGSRPGGDAAKK